MTYLLILCCGGIAKVRVSQPLKRSLNWKFCLILLTTSVWLVNQNVLWFPFWTEKMHCNNLLLYFIFYYPFYASYQSS